MRKTSISSYILLSGVILIFAAVAYMAGAAAASTGSSPAGGILSRIRGGSSEEQLIGQALAIIEHQYYKNITPEDRKQLIYGAIEGMVGKLAEEPFKDHFSSFYSPTFYDDLAAQTSGDYAGVGILMGLSADMTYPEVVTVFPGTPAEIAGVLSDDIIVNITSGEEDPEETGDTFNMPLYEVATKIKGIPGTTVRLKIARPGQTELMEFEIERAAVHYSSIQNSELLDGGVGFIEITNFAEDTGVDFRSKLDELTEQAGGQLEAVVIDLRNNTGGLLDTAVQVANCFIHEGLIVSVQQRGEVTMIEADPKIKKFDVPVVILMNSNTASASEILAAALKDHGVATLVGETSFGKGVVQAVNPMERDEQGEIKSALAVTIGEYFTKGKYEIHNKGVEPNVWFDFDTEIEGDERIGLTADPKLKGLMDELDKKREEIGKLNTEIRMYIRGRDMHKNEGVEIARKLASGQTVADVPAPPEKEEEEHDPFVAIGSDSTDTTGTEE